METVCEKKKCTACMACINICPKNAIRIQDEIEYFNAQIDLASCIHCGLCNKICPNNKQPELKTTIVCKQGWANDTSIRKNSTSGGLATALMKSFILDGGYVCSCSFCNGEFVFLLTNAREDLPKFVGSKYVKSNPRNVYKRIDDKLKMGKKVLFIGLPCQVAGIQNFLNKKDKENLYTIDLICHGTPSVGVLKIFLEQHGLELSRLNDIIFRNKSSYKTDYKSISSPDAIDSYSFSFLKKINFSEACYTCNYATRKRVSDITLGDSWGSNLDKEEVIKGISLALCQTQKGISLIEKADLNLTDVDYEKAVLANAQLNMPSEKPQNRDLFLQSVKKNRNYDRLVFRYFFAIMVKQYMKRFLYKTNILSRKNVKPYHIWIKIHKW